MENNNDQIPGIPKWMLVMNAFIMIILLLLFFLIYGATHKPISRVVREENLVKSELIPLENVPILAKAAFVYDVRENRVIYKKNEVAQLPLASLTKLMMALTAVKIFSKDSHIMIKKEFLEEEGDSGLLADESWKLKDLLDFSLVVSSNDGARSVASVIGASNLKTNNYEMGRKEFINKMNVTAQDLGLKQTYFVNESGLDIGDVSGGYGSAMDIEKLMQYILINNPELLEATKYASLSIDSMHGVHIAKNTDQDIKVIPGLIAGKTGYTSLAGGNLAVAFDASIGRPIIVVVLGSTEAGRFSDVETLVKATLAYINNS